MSGAGVGRGRAAVLRRSISEPASPGGLQLPLNQTQPSEEKAADPVAHRCNSVKLRPTIFKDVRPLKNLKVIEKPSELCSQTLPKDQAVVIESATKSSHEAQSQPVHSVYVNNEDKVLITTSGNLGEKILEYLKNGFNRSPSQVVSEVAGMKCHTLEHKTLSVGNENVLLTGRSDSNLVTEVEEYLAKSKEVLLSMSYDFSHGLTGSALVTPSSLLPAVPGRSLEKSWPACASTPVKTLQSSTSSASTRLVVADPCYNPLWENQSHPSAGNQVQRSRGIGVSQTARQNSLDDTHQDADTTAATNGEDWEAESAGENRPAFRYGADQFQYTSVAVNNALSAPGAMAWNHLSANRIKEEFRKETFCAPVHVKPRVQIDEALKAKAYDRDIRMFEANNNEVEEANAKVAKPQSFNNQFINGRKCDVAKISADDTLTSLHGDFANGNCSAQDLTGTTGDTDWGSEVFLPPCGETSEFKQPVPAAPPPSRLQKHSWQKSSIHQILSHRRDEPPSPLAVTPATAVSEADRNSVEDNRDGSTAPPPSRTTLTPIFIKTLPLADTPGHVSMPRNTATFKSTRLSQGSAQPVWTSHTHPAERLLSSSAGTGNVTFSEQYRRLDLSDGTIETPSLPDAPRHSVTPYSTAGESAGLLRGPSQRPSASLAQPVEHIHSSTTCTDNVTFSKQFRRLDSPDESATHDANREIENSKSYVFTPASNDTRCEPNVGKVVPEEGCSRQMANSGGGDYQRRTSLDDWRSADNHQVLRDSLNTVVAGDCWRQGNTQVLTRRISAEAKVSSTHPKPSIVSAHSLYTRRDLLILSKTRTCRNFSEAMFVQPIDFLVRRDLMVLPGSSAKYFSMEDLRKPDAGCIIPYSTTTGNFESSANIDPPIE